MKQILKQFVISLGAFVAALLIFWGVTVVLADWSEPTQAPPGGNVAAPINIGGATQHKVGKIEADDVWSDDATVWMSEIMKLHRFDLDSLSRWPQGFNMLSNPQQQIGIASLPWAVNGWSVLPTGVLPARVRALVVRASCYKSQLILSGGDLPTIQNPNVPVEGLPYRACGTSNNDDGDSNELVVPMLQTGGGSSFQVRYRRDYYGGSPTVRLDAVGLYYQ